MEKETQKIDGLTKDDWDLTKNELKGQLVAVKLQRGALEGSIAQCDVEMAKYD